MKTLTITALSVFLMATTFSTSANEQENATSATSSSSGNSSSPAAGCVPLPQCDAVSHNVYQQWLNELFMQHLLNPSKTDENQPDDADKN